MNTDELFNSEYTTGNMEAIQFIAGIIGKIAVVVISIVGFGIVMATILKNSMCGLYAVAPKFWDRVDEVKKAGIEAAKNTANGSNNQIFKLLGTVMAVGIGLLPNVKAMTDFDDEMLDAKAYFLKAIPLACIQIFIGVFIFFGYPSQVAQKFSDFGTGLFNVVLTNVDPKAWVEALPDKLAVLTFATDGATDDVSKCENEMAKVVANTYLGAVNDVTKEKRLEVALMLESWIMQNTESGDNPCMDYCNLDKYKLKVTAQVFKNSAPDLGRLNNTESADGTKTFAYQDTINQADSGTALNVDGWIIRYTCIFTPIASAGDTTKVECALQLPSDLMKWDADKKCYRIVVSEETVNGFGLKTGNSAKGQALVNGEEVPMTIVCNNNVITIKPRTSSDNIEGATSFTNIQAFTYTFGGNNHKISSITFGSDLLFIPVDSGIDPWKWGEGPNKGGSTESKSTKDGEVTAEDNPF